MRPSGQNRCDGLGCHIRIAAGEGVVVGEDHVFGAVLAEGGFVVASDEGKGAEDVDRHVSPLFPKHGSQLRAQGTLTLEELAGRSEAHDSGLCAADAFTCLAFTSDPLNLAFAPPVLNRDEKADKDVAEGCRR